MKEHIHHLLYGAHPNLLSAQLQFPYPVFEDQRFTERLTKEQLGNDEHFISFNFFSEASVPSTAVKQSFMFRGLNTLASDNESRNTLKDSVNRFLFANLQSQRGSAASFVDKPHLLPIPFPRTFTDKLFNSDGLLKLSARDNVFVNTAPSLTKFSYDSRFKEQVGESLNKLKMMKYSTRTLLMKDGNIEPEELKERVEVLEGIMEGLRAFDLSDPDNHSDKGSS